MPDYVLYPLLSAAVAFALVPVVVVAAGRRLPPAHVVRREIWLKASPTTIFAKLEDVASYPRWRRHVARVQVVRREPRVQFRERGRHGMLELEVAEARAPERFVLRVVPGSRAIFTGTWTFELAEEDDGTRVTLTEDGEVASPVARLFARYVIGDASNVERTLADLKASFGR